MAKEGPGSTRATIQHAPGPTDGNVSSQVRQTLSWNRVKQRVAKRELKKQLRECQSSLDACQTARDAPSSLFVQMAGHCTLDKKAGRYFLRSEDMDVDTYVFSDRPYTSASTLPTSYFVGYLFQKYFASGLPNAAFTFNVFQNQSEATFEGPLISVLLTSENIVLQDSNKTQVEYELGQSPEQEAVTALSAFFPGVDPNGNASVTFEFCSVFIDNDDYPSIVVESVSNILSVTRNLDLSAAIIEKGPPPGPSPSPSALRQYTRIWQYKDGEGKKSGGVESKVRT